MFMRPSNPLLKIRTAAEIYEEITALKILRGDFGERGHSAAEAARLARLH